VDDYKNLSDHEALIRLISATAQNLFVEFTENKLLYPVSAMVDMGQEVPAPAFNAQDFTPASASGKVLARLPRSMHLQLTARAKTEGVSLNSLVLAFIAEGLGRRGEVRA
jgi:hypothetical protein